jgi:DNA-binding transcriptional LysR family regulator
MVIAKERVMTIDSEKLKRRLKIRDLDTLVTVAKTGSMRKAAKLLNLSEPAISKAIAELESILGVTLLERSRQGISVTVFGQTVLKRATAMFHELQQGARELEYQVDPYGGHINLACTETLNAGLVAVAIGRMSKQHPRLTFAVDSGDTDFLKSHFLMQRKSDFILARNNGAVLEPELRIEPLFKERMQFVVGSNSHWARRRKMKLEDLEHETWILSRAETVSDSPVAKAFNAAGLGLPINTILSGSINLRYALLSTGRFVTVMPHSFLHFSNARSPLKTLPIEIEPWQIPTAIMTLSKRPLSPATNTFLDIVRELARPLNQ